MSTLELGFVGLGRMGAPMASRLIAAGHKVIVHDPVDAAVAALVQKGAQAASSAADVAAKADIVFLSLPTPDIVNKVILGPGGVAEGERARLVVDLSTTGPRMIGQIAEALTRTNRLGLVDCPVSGGVTGAEKGTLAMMVACPRIAFTEVEPLLAVLGKVFFVGEKPGQGQTLKLVNNLLAAAALAVSSEGMVMGVKAGLDPQVMVDVINVSSGRNSATQDKFPRAILPRTFDFGFTTGLSYKDVRLCVDEAEGMGVPMVVGGAVRQFLAMANAAFGAGADFTNMVKLVEGWAGVEVDGRK